LALGLPHFLTRQLETSGRFIGYGTFSNPLGLFPVYPLQAGVLAGWSRLAGPAWLIVANVLALVLFVVAVTTLRRMRPAGSDFLLGGAVLVLGGFLVAVLSSANPYLSFKLLAYGSPLLVLLVFSPLALARRSGGTVFLVAGALAVASAAAATGTEFAYGLTQSKSSTAFSGVATYAARLPQEAIISVQLSSVWDQVWATYHLSQRRLSVEHPSAYLTGFGPARAHTVSRLAPGRNVLKRDTGGHALWRHAGFALYRLHACPGRPVLVARRRGRDARIQRGARISPETLGGSCAKADSVHGDRAVPNRVSWAAVSEAECSAPGQDCK
jgi:hypothetical protein